jgi:YfiH family protein
MKATLRKKATTVNALKRRSSKPDRSTWKMRSAGRTGVRVLEAPSFAKLSWLVHGFSTRPGGVSEIALAQKSRGTAGKNEKALNLGFIDWDQRPRVQENRERFFRALGAAKMRPVLLRQIHSDIVYVVDSGSTQSEEVPKADALITREPGVLLIIQTADCIPILLADTKRKAVAAIHSGWRGTLQRIAEKTLGRMSMEYGTKPADVIAALGPGIGGCCYEVGPEVATDFSAKFANAHEWFDGAFDKLAAGENDPNWLPWLTMRPPGHAPPPLSVQLDLIAANRAILAGAGIPAKQIYSSGYCTACNLDLFFSYRRERTTGRMMAAIGIR